MKKVSLILVVSLIISIALVGCGGSKATNNTQQSSSKTTDQNTGDSQSSNKSSEVKDLAFDFITETYINKNVKIKYPQITGFSNANKQDEINDLIKNDILNDYKKDVINAAQIAYSSNYQEAEASLIEDVNYDIKLNSSNVLSILYTKAGNLPQSMHPNTSLHSVNINIENGAMLKFKDIININYSFVEKLKCGKDKIWKAKSLIEDGYNNDISMEINNSFSIEHDKDLIEQYSEEDYCFYFTKERFVMNHTVSHAAGDYATMEINYSDIKDYIKADNKVWKDFISPLPVNSIAAKYSLGNINDIVGFSPFESQSFMVNIGFWGEVKFVSGKITTGEFVPVVFYLTNKDGDIVYDFNTSKDDPCIPYNSDVKAVSFEDVNKDGLKDIIIITANSSKGSANYGKITAVVYLEKSDGTFNSDFKLNQEINNSENNKDIKTVVNYLSKKF